MIAFAVQFLIDKLSKLGGQLGIVKFENDSFSGLIRTEVIYANCMDRDPMRMQQEVRKITGKLARQLTNCRIIMVVVGRALFADRSFRWLVVRRCRYVSKNRDIKFQLIVRFNSIIFILILDKNERSSTYE